MPNELLILVVLAAIILIFSHKPSVKAVYCNDKTLSPKPDVIMLGASWCPYCYKARRYFVDNDISYCEYDIESSNEGKRMYDGINQHANKIGAPIGIPVLFIGDSLLSGFEEKAIEKALTTLKTL